MVNLFGKDLTREEVVKRVGDISQLAGTRQYELTAGKAKGVGAVDVKTGSGLEFTVLPGRGMDIAWANYRGIPFGYISKTGIVAAEYFHEEENKGFMQNFFAGLLTTGGLTHMGASSIDQGESLGIHGVISNIPAENVSVFSDWVDDQFLIRVQGRVRQSRFFNEDIILKREISTALGEKRLIIKDEVENRGFQEQPFMLLYHINFGYPVVSEDTELLTSPAEVKPRDAEAEKGISSYTSFHEPVHGYLEQCFYFDFETGEDGMAYACLFNPLLGEKGLGAYVRFNKQQLPYFTEWKQMGEQEYVVGLEPCTWYPEGRAEARKRGELEFIKPGEVKKFEVEIGIIEDKDELK
jgi:galactose mutarotase-like enzyme